MTNKRINIQYSIDLSELSDEVQRLYDKAHAKFDLILSDIQSIVSSYVEYEASSTNPQPQPEAPIPTAGMPEIPNMSNMDLAEISKLFNGGVSNEIQKPDQRSK